MIQRNLFLVPKLFLLSIVVNMIVFNQVLSSQCESDASISLRIKESLVAFIGEDADGNEKVKGTGFVLNIFGDIAAPKHVLIDNGEVISAMEVQYSKGKSMEVEEFILLENSLNLENRDWVILKKNYTRKPEFTDSEREYAFLNISHDRHIEDIPKDGLLWRVESFKSKSIEVKSSPVVGIRPHPELPGIFLGNVKSFGGDSGSPYVSNCGEVHGILRNMDNREDGDFDHTGALMELALHHVVDFDTPQGIFRGEPDRRDHRKSDAFWDALQAQLDFTDRELNLLNWKVRVEDWALDVAGENDLVLKGRIEYKRIERPSQTKQHRPKSFLPNIWACLVWDSEVAEETCIRNKDLRYPTSNGFESAKEGEEDIFEAGVPFNINYDQFRHNMDDIKSRYSDIDFSVEKLKGILVRFEPKFNTFNTLRHYDKNTGYPQELKVKPGVFSAVYEACIPSEQVKRVDAKLISTSIEPNYSGVLTEYKDREVTSCISELK